MDYLIPYIIYYGICFIIAILIMAGTAITLKKVLSSDQKKTQQIKQQIAQEKINQTQARIEHLQKKIENESVQLNQKINSLTDASQIEECKRKLMRLSLTKQYIANPKVIQIADDIVQRIQSDAIIEKYDRDIRLQNINIDKSLVYTEYIDNPFSDNIELKEISWYNPNGYRGINFEGENLKPIDNKLQLFSFVDAISVMANLIFQQTYVATHHKDISGTSYTAKIATIEYAGHYDVRLIYQAPNGYYQPPKEWL